jgi:hypothetical protein
MFSSKFARVSKEISTYKKLFQFFKLQNWNFWVLKKWSTMPMFHKLFSSATMTTIDICIMCVACKIQLLIVLSRFLTRTATRLPLSSHHSITSLPMYSAAVEGPRRSPPDRRGRWRRRRRMRCVHGWEWLMRHERSGDCTETGDSAVMPRLPRFLHAYDRGRFWGVFCLCPAWPWGNRRFGHIHWACAKGAWVLWASKRTATFSPGPGPTAHRLPIAPLFS